MISHSPHYAHAQSFDCDWKHSYHWFVIDHLTLELNGGGGGGGGSRHEVHGSLFNLDNF